ncbi:hypothetical protein V2J09_000586 [Rumex salicifolius]
MAEGYCSDAYPAFELLLSCPTGLSPSQVNVDFAEAYDRIPHPDVNLENSIAKIWDQKLQSNPSLYNGQKFRFGGFSLCNTNRGSGQIPNICLKLGLTDYRTFVGTNLSSLWEKFIVPSEDDIVRCQHTANPLGNGAIVMTSDQKILVLRRSNKVGEFPGHFVFPGGHPEPQDASVCTHDKNAINSYVTQEMFNSIIREVVEEIGVPATSLLDPLFIGISQRTLNVRPAAFFFIRCNLKSQEVQLLYGSAQDGFESTHLYAVSTNELMSMVPNMPGCHQGGFALYNRYMSTLKT